MKVWKHKNERGGFELGVDVYGRLTKRGFATRLSEFEGVKIIKSPTTSCSRNFCSFEYKGESFSIDEDDADYTYSIRPAIYNPDTLQALENYLSNLHIPKHRTRPVFWFAGIVLIGLALYANI